MTHTYYIGLDVHKETIAIAHALGGSRNEPAYHGQCAGSVAAVVKAGARRGLARRMRETYAGWMMRRAGLTDECRLLILDF